MRVSAALPVGVAALFFDAARRRRRMEARLSQCLAEEGYSEVVLPIVDYFEPYEPLLGAERRGELYRFVDRDGQLLSLRADFTPMLARLLAPRITSFDLPLRLFYRGDVVRYQEEQAGRMRELYQLGAELIGRADGGDGEAAGDREDAELLRVFLSLLVASGAAPGRDARMQVVLGFAGALDAPLLAAAGGGDAERAAGLARSISRRERLAARGAGGEAGRCLLDVVEGGVPSEPGCLGAEASRRLAVLSSLVEELGREFPTVRLSIDLAEFADLHLDPRLTASPAGGEAPANASNGGYYDGIAFRAYVGDRALPVGAGGRYDRLFRVLEAPVRAVGFSLGLDRLTRAEARHGEGEA